MAEGKKSVSKIKNKSCEDNTRIDNSIKCPPSKSINNLDNNHNCNGIDDDEIDELVEKFGQYGNTPPRTRMKIKNRDWDRKQRFETCINNAKKLGGCIGATGDTSVIKRGLSRLCRSRVQRRNTMDCAILNEIFIEEENKNRIDKRAQALLRESERDMKHQSATINSSNTTNFISNRVTSFHEAQIIRNNNCNNNNNNVNQSSKTTGQSSCILRNRNSCGVPTLIESCNRYMSVTSRPIGCRVSAPPASFILHNISKIDNIDSTKLQSRKEFHETFANLIKLGSIDRQEKLSNEEHNWQTELKDLIWLELQAWQADRTLEQQDKYLFSARQGVPELLNQILNYKYRPKYRTETSVISTDSGIGSDSLCNHCSSCLSLYCKDCSTQQSQALKEIEELLTRLEAAEALYPSSQQLALFHPIYKSESFVGRVKAMCLWYNITRQHRLKLIILGKLLARLQGEKFNWPIQTSVTESSSSSGHDSGKGSVEPQKCTLKKSIPKVQFDIEENPQASPSESLSSEASSSTQESSDNQSDGPVIGEYTKCVNDINIFNVEPLVHITYDNVEHSTKLYRKYIENVLKSRGLAKSLAFLHQLHNIVLYKAKISLEKPGTDENDESENDIFDEEEIDDDKCPPQFEPYINQEQIDELRRYGRWSPEAISIGLPSYIPTFIFLSVVPLEVIHEFLRMRMETRPIKPNPLSLEQLMKELKEGLILALTHRERFYRHITTALIDNEKELDKYSEVLDQFDSTVKRVFELYLDYTDQWVLVAAPETHQKSALDKEWVFIKLISPMIPGMHILAAAKFCLIIRKLLRSISDRLINKSLELDGKIEDPIVYDDAKKWQLLTICRETQTLFTVERECSVKLLFFARSFCRDVEQSTFHREHEEEYLSKSTDNDFVCPAIKESFKLLSGDVLDVRNKLIKIIERVQERCNIKNMLELDEQDKIAILSRSREILHQGYKFGFEYNKDVIRLFEQKIMSGKNIEYDLDLSLGIITFAKMWIQFVTERCERGRGVRPRWATQGLEFLILACDPQISRHLDEVQFEDLKKKMDLCISHVIGVVSEPEKVKKKASPRTRKTSSPAVSRSRTPTRSPMSAGVIINANQKFLHPQFSLKEDYTHGLQDDTNSSVDSTDFPTTNDFNPISFVVPTKMNTSVLETPALHQIRVRDAVNSLDLEIENKLREKNLIGLVKTNSSDKVHIRARSVTFRWHRGIKIGQGRFGKVYTAVNNTSGELMAMKEIAIQPGETRSIKNVAEELKILEGIIHRNLVKYYGIEIHREELLIFMELCSEGTLESLVELSDGLHEGLTRRFTAQLLSGVAELHKHGIVHRDIKTANIFLFDGGNSLKLGDFGSAVKIQAHTTVPGELQGYVGTQAYMAPEIFTKTNSDGHGRAADIWSTGCVGIEMVSGKRPWSQFDSNFQIMFKVGMGEKPEIPQSLSQEGTEFMEICLQHDPKLRLTAMELLQHNFCKVEVDEVSNKDFIRVKNDSQGRRSLRRTRR